MFNYQKFLGDVGKELNNEYTEDFVKCVLELPESYDKDNYESIGKRLIIKRLKFTGNKENREPIDFDRCFDSGVNVIIAENSMGKSSIFKIIKFLLTGDKSPIKKDVYQWLDQLYLEFEIGNVAFSAYINLSNPRIKGGLYKICLEELLTHHKNEELLDEFLAVFQVNSEEGYQKQIEEFFFDQFKYYNLYWMSSNKSKIDLVKNQTSWKTYYKSIYLESKDYDVLFLSTDFGAQGRKILEMILGLKFTYPINSLNIKKENFKNEIKKQTYFDSLDDNNNNEQHIVSRIDEINLKIDTLKNVRKESFSKSSEIGNYHACSMELYRISENLTKLMNEKTEIEKETVKLEKYILNLEEDLEFGLYFSNLSIKKCPRCESHIKDKRRQIEELNHKCMVCDSDMDSISESDKEDYELKISELKRSLSLLTDNLMQVKALIEHTEGKKASLLEEVSGYENKIQKKELSDEAYIDSLQSLIEARVELEVTLDRKNLGESGEDPEIKIRIIDKAIELLTQLRFESNKAILTKFSTLIKEQLQTFGVSNIENVYFNDHLEPVFVQNHQRNKFFELNEGEQLRVKLSFYISLILLDIEFKVGRHSRFVIIDSPGKEEVISKDLIALASTIRSINNEHSNNLQIFIGSALSELSEATSFDKLIIKKNQEPIF